MPSSAQAAPSATVTVSPAIPADTERRAFRGLSPEGFFIRHPPAAHQLNDFYTEDDDLFQTIHMGGAVVDPAQWVLSIDGLVQRPFSLNLSQLRAMPSVTVTAFHECYGSPIKPPTDAVWRIGNVTWTGVPLQTLLKLAEPTAEASFVWSDGLDCGEFAGVKADCYQKDLPLHKAMSPEVLVAYQLNGAPLSKKRGGPVRLVVPGWFGTNSTKWLCRLSVQATRASGPYTTTFYNEIDPGDVSGKTKRPVWEVEVNSIITRPAHQSQVATRDVQVEGWAWSHNGIQAVEVSSDNGATWMQARTEDRVEFSWQRFSKTVRLDNGTHHLVARALSNSGVQQPMSGRRNHVHRIDVRVDAE